MTVSELALGNYGKIKLGANRGSGFVFCGDVSKIDIEQLDHIIIDCLHKAKNNAQSRVKRLKNKPIDYIDYEHFCNRKKLEPSENGYKVWLQSHSKEIKTARKSVRTYNERIRNYSTIKDRPIVEVYDSFTEDNTKIVIFDGREHGFAWTTEEFEKADIYESEDV